MSLIITSGLVWSGLAEMEVMSEDGSTLICPNPKNYPEKVTWASGTVTDGTIVACGGSYDNYSKFF